MVFPWIAFATAHRLSRYLSDARVTESALDRLPTIARSIAGAVFDPAAWGILAPAVLVVLVLARPSAFTLSAGAAGLGALLGIYAMVPFRLDWALRTSVTRLVITPLGLLALAAATASVRRPRVAASAGNAAPGRDEQALAEGSPSHS